MISKRFLSVLVYALPILIVAFAAVMGAQSLSRALGDLPGARALDWAAVVALLLLVVDVLLLVGALGIKSLSDEQESDDES